MWKTLSIKIARIKGVTFKVIMNRNPQYFVPLILVGMLFVLTSCHYSNKQTPMKQIPLRDFFRNPEKTAFQISPNGKYLTWMAPVNQRLNVFAREIGNEKAIQLTHETARDVSGYFWANNHRILFLKDSGGDENYKLFGVNIDGSNLKPLTDFPGVKTQVIDDLEDIEDEVIIGLNKRNPEVFDAYRLNIVTGEMTLIAENPGNIMGWMTDHNGKLRLAITSDGVNSSILYRKEEKESFKTILTTNFRETMSPVLFTFDNKNLYAVSNLGRDKTAAVEFDPETSKEIKKLYENPDFDISNIGYSRKRKVITSAIYTSWKNERHFFDEETKKIFEFLRTKLGDKEFGFTDRDKNEENYIIRTYNDRTPGAYYLFSKSTRQLEKIAEVAPWLDENELSEMKPVQFKSRDGLTIHGYLTLPDGMKPHDLPVVVNPHGGPWARDSWGYDPEVQFLANRGYAVFQMNFRGSTGYGREFWEKSFKQWGKTMQDDITDGVRWLINEGIADPKHIAIYGGSYGGYATLVGLTLTPQLYAAGVDYVGVSNLFTFMKTIPPYWKPMLEMMYEMVGDPGKKEDSLYLSASSPVFHADKIMVPLLIAQGANDPRVNKDESDQMVKALKERGIEVEYLVKDNEGHGFRNEENRFEFYEAMEKFLHKHIGMKNYKVKDDGVI
jgi:dipeptidyl aminopeptidase/acylaminoacyl peptidase